MSISELSLKHKMNSDSRDGHHIHYIESADGLNLAINMWVAKTPLATLFYIHGIQSHFGWLFETGPYLAKQGINVIAMDRRGSGSSDGIRGHADSSDQILRDYQQAWEYASGFVADIPFIALGQSFGGSILAALLCRYQPPAAAYIFSAPALGQQRLRYDPHELCRRRAQKNQEHCLVGLRDVEYSNDEKYLRFIANDALINRSITTSMASSMVEMEDIYYDNKFCLQAIRSPVHLIEPKYDSIIDMRTSREVLSKYIPVQSHVIDTMSHYIEFSNKRLNFWKTLIDICVNTESSNV